VRLNNGLLILFCIFAITRVSIPELLDCERLDLVAALATEAAKAVVAALASLRLLRSTFKILDKMSPFFQQFPLILKTLVFLFVVILLKI